MIRDVELAEEELSKKAGGPQGSRSCLCLSLFSFLLVAGATTLFCLLHFGVIGPQREEVSLWPALAYSLTQREMRKRARDGVGKEVCLWGRVGRKIVEKDGEVGGDMERDGRKRETDGEIRHLAQGGCPLNICWTNE